jgi:hypothetical protein
VNLKPASKKSLPRGDNGVYKDAFRQTRRHKRPQRACLTARTFRLRLLPPSSLRLPVHCATVARRIRTRGHLAHGHWHADIARALAAGWNVRVPSRFSAAARPVRFVAARGLGLAADAQHCSWQPECQWATPSHCGSLRPAQLRPRASVKAPVIGSRLIGSSLHAACGFAGPCSGTGLNLKRPLPST